MGAVTILGKPVTERDERRFWAKVSLPDANGCMNWIAGVVDDGYGSFRVGGRSGKTVRAHRMAYALATGTVPELPLDHLCRNPACVAADHLEPVTIRENTKRGPGYRGAVLRAWDSGACLKGHVLAEVGIRQTARGFRKCAQCARDREMAYRVRKKDRAA